MGSEVTTLSTAVLGAGSWGTAIASLLSKKGVPTVLWARDTRTAETIARDHRNPRYLSDQTLPQSLVSTDDLGGAVADAAAIILAVPSHGMREICTRLTMLPLRDDVLFLSLAKGIEAETSLRMSEVIGATIGEQHASRIAVLSGPNHAEEVIREIPSATVIASISEPTAIRLQDVFMAPYFRVYTNTDLVGVEVAGAVKNVIAIAAGISDGLGFGDNTKASLVTRGLAEMVRLGSALGANPMTFLGLAGIGDLVVTATSRHSRNRMVGERLGRGEKIADILKSMQMVAEGVRTAPAALALGSRIGVELPITDEVVAIIDGSKDPRESVLSLMDRPPSPEMRNDL